jgi:hypothetical protein
LPVWNHKIQKNTVQIDAVNAATSKDAVDVQIDNGLLYHVKFIAGVSGRVKLNPIGYGAADESNGNIVNGLDGITTALTIIKDAYIIK